MELIILIGVFVFEILGDYLSCLWHDARESGKIWTQTLISMILGALNWIPVWFAITLEDWRIALISVLGTGLGTALGAFSVRRKNRDAVIQSPVIVRGAFGVSPTLKNSASK